MLLQKMKLKKLKAFNESMLVNNGLKNQEEIEAFYRLKLARKKYAAQLEKKIQEADQLAKEDKRTSLILPKRNMKHNTKLIIKTVIGQLSFFPLGRRRL